MKFLLAAALVIVIVTAQRVPDVVPADSPLCNKKGFNRQDKTKFYKVNINVTKTFCAKSYLDACYTVDGIVPCNTNYERCVSSNSEWNDATYSPISASRMTERPQLCASEGAFWHPETGVLAVAQPCISFIVSITALVILKRAITQANVGRVLQVLLGIQVTTCVLLFFSFYYLNALIALLVTYAAVGLYASKDKNGIAVGLIAIIAVLFWFTFQHGLGEIQHHSRFSSDLTAYETLCNHYYRGYFGWPILLHGPYESPSFLTKGYCLREWLAAEYFAIILVKITLLIFVAYGAAELRSSDAPTEAPKEETPAANPSQPEESAPAAN